MYMYAGRVACCSHDEYAPHALLKLERRWDRQTDGRTPDQCITLTARRGQRNKWISSSSKQELSWCVCSYPVSPPGERDETYASFGAYVVPRLQGVVYCTWSTTSAENEAVVSACVEEVNSALQTRTPYNPGPSVLPLSVTDIDSGSGPLIGKAMHFRPSSSSCGCFVATVTREVSTAPFND